ncbi:globoside alpha-1,3-N-acetylgalactosaminyltransferase 1-like [Pseudoliparis swirei]|uniref:globoside alpha-1,3-N-acetylgalactosaminyltransferase 1-like n=1 Tax=Pseudoliparis swirei TaxID=2059687 RepID=UPI0024BDFFC7|nr:globoside alpha-1,3-N-acetylgalactosaminyltransferase 1-like [Pseudoliparis swirei]
MALFPFCKTASGPVRVTRTQLVLYAFLLSLVVYFLNDRKAAFGVESPRPAFPASGLDRGGATTEVTVFKPQTPLETPWGAPLVWGDTPGAARRRAKFAQRGVRTGLLALVVGTYARFVRRFLSSAETHFLPGQMVTYYILTDNPRTLDPPVELGPKRELRVLPVSELPGWERLARRRMVLLADAIQNPIVGEEVDYVFCADVDQEFVAPVGEEILGELVGTLHPELFGMPRTAFPYEIREESAACVKDDEGDYYYTSELFGGSVAEMYRLARACSLLILRDQANGLMAGGLEESYLNRYLADRRPSRVLSPEYSWWSSALAADVSVQRLVSLGRTCEARGEQDHNACTN